MEKISYRSYLLRLWLVNQNGRISWHSSLESPQTGQRQLFSRVEEMYDYLDQLKVAFEAEKEDQ